MTSLTILTTSPRTRTGVKCINSAKTLGSTSNANKIVAEKTDHQLNSKTVRQQSGPGAMSSIILTTKAMRPGVIKTVRRIP